MVNKFHININKRLKKRFSSYIYDKKLFIFAFKLID